jgi:hypothetical protein
MLQAIEVIVEPGGTIRALEEVRVAAPMRALLTVLEPVASAAEPSPEPGQAAAIWALLQSPRFARRPVADPVEVGQRIEAPRNDWDDGCSRGTAP